MSHGLQRRIKYALDRVMALAQSDAAGRRDGLTAVVESGSDDYLARLKAEAEAVSAARAQIDELEATQAAALDAAEQRLRR